MLMPLKANNISNHKNYKNLMAIIILKTCMFGENVKTYVKQQWTINNFGDDNLNPKRQLKP